MATTTYLGLVKPDGDDDADVLEINGNTDKIDVAIGRNNLFFSVSNLSSLPHTITNTAITTRHRVVNCVLSNTLAQPSDWTYSTSDGSITISGTISGTTNVYLFLSEIYS